MKELQIYCRMCNMLFKVNVTEQEWKDYQMGMLAQKAFPNMSADERELIISQTCSLCWDELFSEEEDDD